MRYNRFRTLVLNTDGIPLAIVSWKRAIILLFDERVQQLDFYAGYKVHDGKGRGYPIPAVVMRKKYIRRDYRFAPFSKKNVFIRDHLTCQYCGNIFGPRELTFDHVIPRSKWRKEWGAPTCWENIVTCCIPCNRKKDNKACEQAKMFPIMPPIRPNYTEFFLGLTPWKSDIPPEWGPYLQNLPLFRGLKYYGQEITV